MSQDTQTNLKSPPRRSVYDPLLGFSKETDIPGYDLWPDNAKLNDSVLKIMVLGGSTSTWPLGCWSKELGQKIVSMDTNVIIFNGGNEGYTSSHELLKLIRDIPAIKPDIIISLSGINDLGKLHCVHEHPLIHRYQAYIADFLVDNNDAFSQWNTGLPYTDSSSDIWLRNIRQMNAIAQEENIPLITCLQPTMVYGNYKPEESELSLIDPIAYRTLNTGKTYIQEVEFFYDNVRNEIKLNPKSYSHIIDLTHAFEGKSLLFNDYRHQNNKGDKILANRIFEHLKLRKLI